MEFKFGIHKGRNINDPEVPTSYLRWLLKSMQENIAEITVEITRRTNKESMDMLQLEQRAREILRDPSASKADRQWAYSFLNKEDQATSV